MILLLTFLSLFLGINIRHDPISSVIILILFSIYVLIRYDFKKMIFVLIVSLAGFALSFITFSFNQISFNGIVIESKNNYFILLSKFEKFYVYYKDNPYQPGDILSIEGKKDNLSFVALESQFNFTNYLNSKGIFYELSIENLKEQFIFPLRIKATINNVLNNYSFETKNIISNLLFSNGIYDDIKGNLDALHLNRLLSMSGLYLGVITAIFEYFLSYLIKNEKIIKGVSLFGLFIYSLITFPKFSVLRIFVLRLSLYINDLVFKRKFSYLEIISFTGILFLLFDHFLAYQDSFLLGYIIPIISYYISSSFKFKNRAIRSIIMSLIILIIFIPFEIKYYYSVNLILYPLQIIFTPIFIVYILLSILAVFNIPINALINSYSSFLLFISNNAKKISFYINVPELSNIFIFIYIIVILLLLYYILINFKMMINAILIPFLLVATLYVIPIKNTFTSEVSFINVGQGDSCLIRNKNETVLIDTGGSLSLDIAKEVLIPYFRKNRIYQIDYLITTHDDYDHAGAKESLIDNMKVKNYVNTTDSFPLKTNGLTINNYNTYKEAWSDENDSSLVLSFTVNNSSYLIMGDAPIKIENLILNDYPDLKCDYIKIGHHGSNTSSSYSFLKSIEPKEAIISVGKNKYGHPSDKVISILNSLDIKIRRTDKEGTIKYT